MCYRYHARARYKRYRGKEHTPNSGGTLGRVIYYAVYVVSKERRRLVLPRTYFFLHWMLRFYCEYAKRDPFYIPYPSRLNGNEVLSLRITRKEFVPNGRTIKVQLYLDVMGRFLQRIRRVWPDFHENNNWLLLHDNAPAYTALILRK
jgi:hypothetical protein